jgi:hypothetical protein
MNYKAIINAISALGKKIVLNLRRPPIVQQAQYLLVSFPVGEAADGRCFLIIEVFPVGLKFFCKGKVVKD